MSTRSRQMEPAPACGPRSSRRSRHRGGPAGVLYAASSPTQSVSDRERKSIRALRAQGEIHLVSHRGNRRLVVCGYGEPANVYKIQSGKGELYYETGSPTSLRWRWMRKSAVLAGTEPNGILYRITAKDKHSSCTMRACRRSDPSCRCRMGPFMRLPWRIADEPHHHRLERERPRHTA